MGKSERIKPIVDKIMRRLRKEDMGDVRNCWEVLLGEDIASHATPVSIKDGKLFVEVDSSTWLQHLTLKRKEILEKLTDGLSGQSIREICFRHGSFHTVDHGKYPKSDV